MQNNPLIMQQILANMQKQNQAGVLQLDPSLSSPQRGTETRHRQHLWGLLFPELPQGQQIAYDNFTGRGRLEGYPMTYATNYFDGSVDKNLLVPKKGVINDAQGYSDDEKKYRADLFNSGYMNLNNQFREKQ